MFESEAVQLTVTPKANTDPESLAVNEFLVAQTLEGESPVPVTFRREDYDFLYELTSELPCVDPGLNSGDTCTTSETLNSDFIVAGHIPDLAESLYFHALPHDKEPFLEDVDYLREACPAWSRERAKAKESVWIMTVANNNPFIDNDNLKSHVSGKCLYASCSNYVAQELGVEISANQQE